MWLLDVRKCQLRLFDSIEDAPPFAALSHCWEPSEVTFADLRDHERASRKAGYQKLRRACETAESLGLQWLWADTVCINRTSSAELTESVNSCFRWYQTCQVCIVHLSDFRIGEHQPEDLKARLSRCRWMRRAWTLQELIAPRKAQFYDESWSSIGSKASLCPILSEITRIDVAALEDPECLFDFSIGRRMSWAAHREARHMEDIAYSLVGLFRVSMPVLYGEGRRAFIKLQEEIMKETDDASLFAWSSNDSQQYRGILAHDPSEFYHFASRVCTAPLRIRGDILVTSAGCTIEDVFGSNGAAQDTILGLYSDEEPNNPHSFLGVLFREWNDRWVRSTPQLVLNLSALPAGATRRIRINRDLDERTSGMIARYIMRGGNVHHPTASISKAVVPPWREGTGESFAHPSSITQPQSPGTRSLSIFQRTDCADSVDTDTKWSAVGTLLTGSLAPLPNPCKPRYTASTSAVTSPGFRCFSPETMDHNTSVREDEEQLSVCHDTLSDHDDSGEDDMQLFTIPPPKQPKLDPGHPFANVKDELAEHALGEFARYVSHNPCSKRARTGTTSSASKRRKSESFEAHVEVHKPSDLEDEDMVFIGYRKPCKPTLSCPFYRHDPAKYRNCLARANLQSIKALKQHLWTHHRRPYFCPTCREKFETATECGDHVRRRECNLEEGPEIEGITEDQVQNLAPKSNTSLSLQEQWLAIWDIVFPGEARPLQPFLSGNLESLVCLLREYWANEGKDLIADFLDARIMRDYYELQDEERNLGALFVAVLHQIVDRAVDRMANSDTGLKDTATPWNIMDVVRGLRLPGFL